MSLTDELQKLEQLRSSGALSAEEFQRAKTQVLSAPDEKREFVPDKQQESIGKAANRYVSLQIVMAVIGGIIFLIVFFSILLPAFFGGSFFR